MCIRDRVKTTTVFARVSPTDKLRIIQSLKRIGEVAAMTGDGVNDSPALKAADIGVAMGQSGTDVAKDAADVILLDDNFTTIEYAIREGRRVYRNIQKVIQLLLAGNIAEILVLFIATVLNWEPPILAVHILLILSLIHISPQQGGSQTAKPARTGIGSGAGGAGRQPAKGFRVGYISIFTAIDRAGVQGRQINKKAL